MRAATEINWRRAFSGGEAAARTTIGMSTLEERTEPLLTREELNLHSLELIEQLQELYQPGRDRKVTPENVYQPAVMEGRELLEKFVARMLLSGSRVEGLEQLDDCLLRQERGESILFLPEHRGNLDTPTFYALLGREEPKYRLILERLVYVAGRKLNESSDFIKMFTEKYSRLVIVPRRDFPGRGPGQSEQETARDDAIEHEAHRINRSAFRALVRLRKEGHIFVLFPLGGRLKPDADNIPVRETTSYMRTFDTCFPISMEGNILPPLPRMEDERPQQDRVVFRVGAAIECKPFLAQQAEIHKQAIAANPATEPDYEQFTVNRILKMLESLRQTGQYDTNFQPK